MNNFRTPNRDRELGYEVSSIKQIFICADCEGDDTLSLQQLGYHRQRCSLDQCGFTRAPWENWTTSIPYHIRRNHRPYLKTASTITFRYGHDRLFCGCCDVVGRNLGLPPWVCLIT